MSGCGGYEWDGVYKSRDKSVREHWSAWREVLESG